jgi:phosphatidylserine/phosphatidylglycerophosphate/cardiolipin synthase-like enzyme
MGDQTDWYSGDSSYKEIEGLIKSSRFLKIISPYISPYYAKMLLSASQKKEIKIITSNSKINQRSISILSKKMNSKIYIKSFLYIITVGVIFAVIQFYFLAILTIIALILVAALALIRYSSIRKRKLYLKVAFEKFIHEKLYISDNAAISGSANLTYSGLHKNIEHIEMIDDKSKIDALAEHFDSLWNGVQ